MADMKNEHGLGKGTGAAAGAVAGGAIGSAAGPVGTVAGAVVGGVAGYAAGGAIAESVNPNEYDSHFQKSYASAPYYSDRYTWNDYQPAYQYGYNTYGQYKGQRFEDIEPCDPPLYGQPVNNESLPGDGAGAVFKTQQT